MIPHFFGCSLNSGEGRPDFQEEVRIVSVSVGDALDDLDLVIDAFHQVRPERPPAVGQDAREIRLQTADKDAQRLQPASQGTMLP